MDKARQPPQKPSGWAAKSLEMAVPTLMDVKQSDPSTCWAAEWMPSTVRRSLHPPDWAIVWAVDANLSACAAKLWARSSKFSSLLGVPVTSSSGETAHCNKLYKADKCRIKHSELMNKHTNWMPSNYCVSKSIAISYNYKEISQQW